MAPIPQPKGIKMLMLAIMQCEYINDAAADLASNRLEAAGLALPEAEQEAFLIMMIFMKLISTRLLLI